MKALRFVPLLLLAAACSTPVPADSTSTDDASELVELPTPRKGDTIDSPSVSQGKMYWGARTIATLVAAGALTPLEASVAKRADGILANSPGNGLLGVDELAILENPEHASSLFPEERAAIAKLWSLLEIADAPVRSPGLVEPPLAIQHPPTPAPYHMPISTLAADDQLIARRIELTQNGDGDATTISGRDVAGAEADRGSYLPAEAERFGAIHDVIARNAPPLTRETALVSTAVEPKIEKTMFEAGVVKVVARVSTMPVAGRYEISNRRVTDEAHVNVSAQIVVVGDAPDVHVIALDKATGKDALVVAPRNTISSTSRIEIWSGGRKLGEIDAQYQLPVKKTIPYGYSVKVGSTLFELDCSTNAQCGYVTATSFEGRRRLDVPPTSYAVLGGDDVWRMDVFPAGWALLTAPDGKAYTVRPNDNLDRAEAPLPAGTVVGEGPVSASVTENLAVVAYTRASPAFGAVTRARVAGTRSLWVY